MTFTEYELKELVEAANRQVVALIQRQDKSDRPHLFEKRANRLLTGTAKLRRLLNGPK